MMREARWAAGVLAALLCAVPAVADDRPGEPRHEAGSAAERAADATRDAARDTGASAGRAAGTLGEKAKAAGQQVTSEAARTLARLHAANEAEIQAGQWMKEHGASKNVRSFAGKMVKDHTAMDEDVMKLAQKHGVDLSSAPKPADATKGQRQGKLDELKGMQGAQADRTYATMMVEDHTGDLREVREAETRAKGAKDPLDKDLASLLGKSARTMEGHLKDARKLDRDLTARQARTPSQR